MRKARFRFLKPYPEDDPNPERAIYHVVSRVVDRQFVLDEKEKEYFRMLMRMYERFSGCRVLSYCFMTNHFHLLLEVPDGCDKGEVLSSMSDGELIRRLGGLYSKTYVAGVERAVEEARKLISGRYGGVENLTKVEIEKNAEYGRQQLHEIHARYSYRMHSLSEFMKGFLQRFTRWFNRENGRRGTLWEERFRSVIVEGGLACRTIAAYIDLNPVRAGIVEDPADYRWSSYGEAVAGGRGSGVARAGLVRALHGHDGREGSSRGWAQGGVSKEYRRILISAGIEKGEVRSHAGKVQRVVVRKGMRRENAEAELERLTDEEARDLQISKVIRCRVRYFTDGAVIGSKKFVNDAFDASRERFSKTRKDGARRPKGALKDLSGQIWSMRDLQKTE